MTPANADVLSIDPELLRVALGCDLRIEHNFADAGGGDSKAEHPVDRIDGRVCVLKRSG
jgi:hypothetical protein